MTITLEEEVLLFLHLVIPDNETKARNIDLIAYYHGFGGSTWPTLESSGEHFGIGTRERVRQIVSRNFRDRVGDDDLPELRACAALLASNDIWFASHFSQVMMEQGWAQDSVNIRGVLNMMHSVGLCEEFNIYDARIRTIGRERFDEFDDFLILDSNSAAAMKAAIKEARRLPGLIGLADAEHLNHLDIDVDTIIETIRLHPDSWIGSVGGTTYFCFEDRENILVNFAGKAFSLADSLDIGRLAETFSNALRARSTELSYPTSDAIEKYIRGSRLFQCSGNTARFEGDLRELTDIDRDIVAYVSERGSETLVPIRGHLVGLGYGLAHITKAVGNSPIVHVDRSAGRKQFSYSLVSHGVAVSIRGPQAPDDERYALFARRLQRIYAIGGTDADAQSTRRREQAILSEYLFEGRTTHRCAICGDEHDVVSLVTAHKKRRSLCNERERLDPHIVMPLCVFGCDHLYERGLLRIVGGLVTGHESKATGAATRAFISRVAGKHVPNEWLRGDGSYFQT